MIIEDIERRTIRLYPNTTDTIIQRYRHNAAVDGFEMVDIDRDDRGRRVVVFERILPTSRRKIHTPRGWSR